MGECGKCGFFVCVCPPRCEYCGVPAPNHEAECRVLAELNAAPAHEHGAWIPVEWVCIRNVVNTPGSQPYDRTMVTTLRCGVGECGYEVTRGQ